MALASWSSINRAIQKLNLRDDRLSAPATSSTVSPMGTMPHASMSRTGTPAAGSAPARPRGAAPARKIEIRKKGSQSVEGFLAEALQYGASDIHVESLESKIRVRIRLDGVMHDLTEIGGNQRDQIISKIKVMAGLDVGERRLPQDGKFKYPLGQQQVDIRVNCAPTVMGESVVMRVLRQDHQGLSVARLAMLPDQEQQFRAAIEAANGIVLVSGPTGSGKTTTLYSALMELNRGEEKIATVEDPVEYNIDGITQIQVKKDIGLTFSSALRALLRQDPDVILVGEIRDKETAEVAVQAALTGHLVLSSLHSNDAVGTVMRLVNLGIDPLMLVAAVNLSVAQRLVRRICPLCKQPAQATPAELHAASQVVQVPPNQVFHTGQGCEGCLGTGYKGRIAVHEVLTFGEEIRAMLTAGAPALEIQKRARELGMRSIRECAVIKAMQGETSLIEALSCSN